MAIIGIMKDLIKSRNEGIDLLESIVLSIENGTVGIHTELFIKKCRKYLDANTKTAI